MAKPDTLGLRERKKLLTRQAIQEHALRLFLAQGYEATTVEQIAAAAGVSHMTFFRYFPTKEDVVLTDDYDALLAGRLSARPAGEPLLEKLRHAVLGGLEMIDDHARAVLFQRTRLILSTPALRARLWEQMYATVRLIVQASRCEADDFHARVVASAGLSALTTALLIWVENDGRQELPGLMDQALTHLQAELSHSDG